MQETTYHVQLIDDNAAEQAHEVILQEAGDELVCFLDCAHQHPRGLRVDVPKGAPAAIQALDIPACTFKLLCTLMGVVISRQALSEPLHGAETRMSTVKESHGLQHSSSKFHWSVTQSSTAIAQVRRQYGRFTDCA